MDEYEEIISPKKLDNKRNFIDRVKLRLAELYRGNTQNPKTQPDGTKTYIDSYGRLIIEKNENAKVLREIYSDISKSSIPEIEEIEIMEEQDPKTGKDVKKEHREYFKSREDYERYKQNGEQGKFGPDKPIVMADITYEQDGGYNIHIVDNRELIHNLQYKGIEVNGYREIYSTKQMIDKGYVIKQKINYFDNKEKQTAKENVTKTIIKKGAERELVEPIVGEEREYLGRNGDTAKYIDIKTSNQGMLMIDMTRYNSDADYAQKIRNAFNITGVFMSSGEGEYGKNLCEKYNIPDTSLVPEARVIGNIFDGHYEEINGKVIAAEETQKVCFERDGENVKRMPQKSFEELLKDFEEAIINAPSEYQHKDYDEKEDKYNNIFKIGIPAKHSENVLIAKQPREGLSLRAGGREDIEDLIDVFVPMVEQCGLDDSYHYGIVGVARGFDSPFARYLDENYEKEYIELEPGELERQMNINNMLRPNYGEWLDSMDIMRLKSQYEIKHSKNPGKTMDTDNREQKDLEKQNENDENTR